MSEKKVAVVTGSNKGIGFAIVKGLCQRFNGTVYLTSRDEARGRAAVAELKKLGLSPEYHQLEVTDKNSVLRFKKHIEVKHGGIDVLINNAAVSNCDDLYSCSYDVCENIIDINYKSILIIAELLFPLIRENGRIVNISSDCGHLSNIRNKYWIEKLSNKNLTVEGINEFVAWYLDTVKNGTVRASDFADGASVAPYRVAKVALSAITIVHQKQLARKNICVNSMHPGLVRTDMTYGVGFYNTDEAAATPIWLALEAPQSLKGAYVWYDRRILDWYDYNADYYFKCATLST